MPPKKRVAATKLRWAKWREEPAEEEPDDEPEVELEEPEEDPTELKPFFPFCVRGAFTRWLVLRVRLAFLDWKCAVALWKIDKEEAERKAVQEAEEKAREEEEEKNRLELLERREVDRLREQQQAAACAKGCVCECRYGFSRYRHLAAMVPPLVFR